MLQLLKKSIQIKLSRIHDIGKTFVDSELNYAKKKKKTQQETVTNQSGLFQLWLPGRRFFFFFKCINQIQLANELHP